MKAFFPGGCDVPGSRAHRAAMRNQRSAKVIYAWWLQNQGDRGAQHRAIVNSQLV